MAPLIFKAFLPPVFLIGLIKGSILFGWATPSEAGAVGGFGAMLLALFNGRLNYATMESVCHSTARTVAMIFFIIIAATCFAYVYRSLGGDDVVDDLITSAGLGPWGLLFLIMGVVFFLGFFLDWIEITLIVLPVFAPLVINLDFGDHVAKEDMVYWFIILMAVNLQTSFLTPPFGFALFYLKGIAPREVKIQSIYLGIIPFVLLQCLATIIVMLYPNLALWMMRSVYDSRRSEQPMANESTTEQVRYLDAGRAPDRAEDQRRAAQLRRLRRAMGGLADRSAGPHHRVRRDRPQAGLDSDLAGRELRPDLRIDAAAGTGMARPHHAVLARARLRLHLEHPRPGRSGPRDPRLPQEGLAGAARPHLLHDPLLSGRDLFCLGLRLQFLHDPRDFRLPGRSDATAGSSRASWCSA